MERRICFCQYIFQLLLGPAMCIHTNIVSILDAFAAKIHASTFTVFLLWLFNCSATQFPINFMGKLSFTLMVVVNFPTAVSGLGFFLRFVLAVVMQHLFFARNRTIGGESSFLTVPLRCQYWSSWFANSDYVWLTPKKANDAAFLQKYGRVLFYTLHQLS